MLQAEGEGCEMREECGSVGRAFSMLPMSGGVVLGPGYTNNAGYVGWSIDECLHYRDRTALFDSLAKAGESDAPMLHVLPYEVGVWFEEMGTACHSPSGAVTKSVAARACVARTLLLGSIGGSERSEHVESGRVESGRVELRLDVGPFQRERYERSVEQAVELIRAGDVFQVNLSHVLRGSFWGSPRVAGVKLAESLAPAFFAYVELGEDEVVICCSPERLVSVELSDDGEGDRVIRTDPIKGTRSALDDSRTELAVSSKDRAELAMIMDLMRNDLGRVCARGTVRVPDGRRVELHHGERVLHAVGTVSGRLGSGVGHGEVVRSVFPPGSVTGAPKVRAMQIIDSLEQRERGAYCGSFVFTSGAVLRSSVNIRTLVLRRKRGDEWDAELMVGAGIVAESDPALEWEETLTKGEPIRAVLSNDGVGLRELG